jgi:hypothetical protein
MTPSIDPKGLRGFRPEHRISLDPDETEGRAIYRAKANAEARMQMGLSRRVILDERLTPPDEAK